MKQLFTLLLVLFSFQIWAQIAISGTVTDPEGQPIVGALILEQGTYNNSLTNEQGNFTLTVRSKSSEISARMLGFSPQTQLIGENATFLFILEDASIMNTVTLIGSRSLNRSKTNSPVPIDVIDVRELVNSQGQLDINQLMNYAAPSFNSNRQSGADGADHVDPAALRGLGPDQTLVLINGKRRHQSALVNQYGTRGRGNTGTDLNTIPASAIERIEILRDGAAAQYGSDAIAGVINIVLKQNLGFSANVVGGVHSAKDNPERDDFDGQNAAVNANYGFKLGDRGYCNVNADYWFRDHTNRTDASLYRQKFGDARGNNFNTTFNAQLPISENAVLYAFGGQNFRKTTAFAWTRDADSDRNITEIYPDGFNPQILSDVTDRSMVAGVRGQVGAWGADFSFGNGSNRFHYYGDKTLNASLGTASPTRFDDGGFQLKMNTTNLDFTRFYADKLKGVNLAFGMEHRIENYQIFAGEEASWQNYGLLYSADSTFDDTGMFVGIDSTFRPGGAQGFPGFSPRNELNENRTNMSIYADGEFDFTEKFTATAAARFERYSDFGNTLNGKIAARYAITKALAIRGSGSTGFRAPSLAQIYFNSVYTDYVSGVPTDKFLANNASNIARALGIPSLTQETSVNLGGGITYVKDKLTISADVYRIAIKDRIVLTGDFASDDPEIGSLLQNLNVGSARFFANAINTTSTGLDLVVSYSTMVTTSGRLNVIFSGNANNMVIDKINVPTLLAGKEDFFLSNREKLFILASAPPMKGTLTLQYQAPKWSATLRNTYFDEIQLEDYVGNIDLFEARTVTDLSFNGRLSKQLSLTVGASNILNAYPTKQDAETEAGGLYEPVQMGFNGRFLFTKLNWNF
jgi:iron complex outermembrane recepter protein